MLSPEARAARALLSHAAVHAGLFIRQCCRCERVLSVDLAAMGANAGLSHGLDEPCAAEYRAEMLTSRRSA